LAPVLRLLARSALVAASLIAAGSAGGSITAAKQTAPAAPLWLGFQDDATFRWGTERQAMLDRAVHAGGTIIRTNVYWWQIAPQRPADARDPFDPGYHFDDLDQLVRDSQARGISLLLTIWGTPPWANGGKGKNYAPTRAADLTNFAYALASRYSGRFPGFPYVGFYSIWNEPNLQQFLAPQFNASGKPVAPRAYATLYKAGYAGVKGGNLTAKVAIGETSPRGHDKPTTNVQPSESPGGFAQQLSKFKGLKFDAWAHHPYPTQPGLPPTQQGTWPNVTLAQLPRFELSLDKWFKRKKIPIWVTEYAYQTRPPGSLGVTPAKQALYLRQGLIKLESDARVKMIIWFTFRDSAANPWKSGLLTQSGAAKPGLAAFTKNAATVTARNNTLAISSKLAIQPVRLSALPIAYFSGPGTQLGLTWRVFTIDGVSQTANQAIVLIGRDGWVTLPVEFRPHAGGRYVLNISGTDPSGHPLIAKRTLVAVS
jgi:Cellulase (glycosyl hydrolase family 5)